MKAQSHFCAHHNKTAGRGRPLHCRRKVIGYTYCYQHRALGSTLHPSGAQGTFHSNSRTDVGDLVAAVQAVVTLTTRNWRRANSRRMREVLGADLHARIKRPDASLCRHLAETADELERAVSQVQDRMSYAVAREVDGRATRAVAHLVAQRLVEQATAAPAEQVATVVRALRVCGIALCVANGRDLARCPCLRALANALARDEVHSQIESALLNGLEPFSPSEAAA
jgi:hypothetical protein